MGLDPENDDYQSVVACVACEAVLFGGATPLYVEALIQNIVQCPAHPPAPNGTVVMTQFFAPCSWRVTIGGIIYSYTVGVGASFFSIISGLNQFFSNAPAGGCVASFVNGNPACGPPGIAGTGGTVDCFWGPGIEP